MSCGECNCKDGEEIERSVPTEAENVAPGVQEPWSKEKSNLYQHAKLELKLAGLLDKDSDYNGMLGEAALDLIEVFARQGHSGCSASLTTKLFSELASYKNLTPISDNPEEWFEVTNMCAKTDQALWQSKRNPALFSNTAGKTYYSVDDKDRAIQLSEKFPVKE